MSRAIVITVSDSRSAGTRPDLSGPAVAQVLTDHGFNVEAIVLIPDEQSLLESALVRHSDNVPLIVTTGGTGLAPRDITPEATHSVCQRLIPGIAEHMRAAGAADNPMAPLSRALCGIRNHCIILNLPGNPNGAPASLRSVIHLLPHALRVLAGDEQHETSA